jgi:DNA invertase Pin-like site-specific DNA recombinase
MADGSDRSFVAFRSWEVVVVYTDAGISGAKGRAQRPRLDRTLRDAGRRNFDVVMAWAIDRVGRSLIDLLGTIQHLEASGSIFTWISNPSTRPRQWGSLCFRSPAPLRSSSDRSSGGASRRGSNVLLLSLPGLGRPKIDITLERKVQKQLKKGVGIPKVAKMLGLGTGTVQRIKQEMKTAQSPTPQPLRTSVRRRRPMMLYEPLA